MGEVSGDRRERGVELSLGQAVFVQGVFPIVVFGLLVPIGLTAIFFGLKGLRIDEAVRHGELFLTAGNAGFTACLSLTTAKRYDPVSSSLAILMTVVIWVLPCYSLWSYMAVQASSGGNISHDLAVKVGTVAAACSSVVALFVVWLSNRPSATSHERPDDSGKIV